MRSYLPLRRFARRAAVLCGVVGVLALAAVPLAPASAQDEPDCAPPGNATPPAETPWQLRRMSPESVWPMTKGEGITVAVIDSGVSPAHPTLAGKVRSGQDFDLPDEAGRCDESGHGTAIAGIIAGRAVPGTVFHGMAPEAAILPGRVLRATGRADEGLPDRLAEAIVWAVDAGAQVVNLSVSARQSDLLDEAVAHATANDVLLVAAAGNIDEDGLPAPGYPAAYDEVIAVAGITENGGHVDTSQIAGYVDVAAPGSDIYGPAPDGATYYRLAEGGTSFAAGFVSGTAALVRAYHPDLSAAEVAQRIIETADRPPEERNDLVGNGVVNPYRAVTAMLGERPNPAPAAMAPPAAEPDPLAFPRRVAAWAALGGGVLAVLLLLAPPAIRRGRQRRWRPARLS